MTHPASTYPGLTERQATLVDALPAESLTELARKLDVEKTTVEGYVNRINRKDDYLVAFDHSNREWRLEDAPDRDAQEALEEATDDGARRLPDLEGVEAEAEDPSPEDLTKREEYILRELQTGTTLPELTEDLDERETVVETHLRDLKREGWRVYIDETAEHVTIEGDHALRSSEHKGTRTRKANRWWEQRHNQLVREFRSLDTPEATLDADAGHEDWVTHMTDLHAGDRVRREDGTIVYETAIIGDVIDYITERSLSLAEKHNSTYDTAHLLWGGDFITNEGIYEGQFEDLDAWLDEQHDSLIDPLVRQVKAFSERFDTVQIVCQIGNHGEHRASGTSRQANADLVLFKTIRNTIAQIRRYGGYEFENVNFLLGEARAYRNFPLRGGSLQGHLRHGQHRKPQAETSARHDQWVTTLADHQFDIAYMGHYHISGRIPWDGPPIIVSPSPKPAGEFVERIGGRTPSEFEGVATAHGVSDDGLTCVFPIDTRGFTPST